MSAMNGSARGRLLGVCMALALVVCAVVFAPAAAQAEEPEPATSTYLALGDSISFGYSQERFNNHYPVESPSFFEEGVANDFAKLLKKPLGKGVRLVNDACPGETSNGLIGENPAVGGKESTQTYEEIEAPKGNPQYPAGGYQGLGDYHPCKYTFRTHLPLHNGGYVQGGKELSQLEEAVATVQGTKSPVKVITLNIGSNDELAAIKQCENEVALEFGKEGKSKYGASPEIAVITCIKETSEKVTVPHILNNIGTILTVIKEVGYKGAIVLMGFYNPDTFILPGSDTLQAATNAAVEANIIGNPSLNPNGEVTFANPFPKFNAGSSALPGKASATKEKKAICTLTEMCNPNVPGGSEGKGDIHPTIKGYKVLAKLVNEAYLANPAK